MARLFDQVIGHSKVIKQLLTAYKVGRLPQTLLLVGPSGIGKSLVARSLAQALVCETSQHACGHCPSCLRIAKGGSEAFFHVAPSGTQIKIEQSQKVRRFLSLQAWGQSRVVIIEEAHTLNVQAANALLKPLEEPPEKTYFILTAVNAYSVLSTLRSRSQVTRLAPLSRDEIKAVGEVEDWMVESCMGRLDVLNQLREPEVMEKRVKALCLVSELGVKSPMDLAKELQGKVDDKDSAIQVIQWWRQFLRDAVFHRDQLKPLIHSDFLEPIERFSTYPTEHLHWLYQELVSLEEGIKGNWDRQLAFEAFFLRVDEAFR